jgi:hypothetical protein
VSATWEVCIKGAAGQKSFEIAVLRSDNEHGKRSYGWFGREKLLISHNGGPCEWPVTQSVWDKLVKVAHEIAAELNAARPQGEP